MEIVKREHALRDEFSSPEAVAEKRAGEASNMGVSLGSEGLSIKLQLLILDVYWAIKSECLSVPRAAGGVHAIKQINPLSDHFEELGRGPKTHGVARLILREVGFRILNSSEHFRLRFSHRNAADGVAIKI